MADDHRAQFHAQGVRQVSTYTKQLPGNAGRLAEPLLDKDPDIIVFFEPGRYGIILAGCFSLRGRG